MHSLVLSFVLLATPIATQPTLDANIASSKIHHPETFARVSSIMSRASELDQRKRGPFAAMGPMLRATGPDAGPALMEPLVHPERFTMPAEESARIALRVGLIEAAGALADPNAAPLWKSIIDGSSETHEVRAAVEALGRVASEADAAYLIALARTKGPKQSAVISGMSSLRRPDAAKAIGDVVDQNDEALDMIACNALGHLGSSWAPDAKAAKIVLARSEAAKQAIRIFLRTKGATRTAASDAVMTIDSADTTSLIAAARTGATPDQNTALDDLAARFAKNPVRQ